MTELKRLREVWEDMPCTPPFFLRARTDDDGRALWDLVSPVDVVVFDVPNDEDMRGIVAVLNTFPALLDVAEETNCYFRRVDEAPEGEWVPSIRPRGMIVALLAAIREELGP